MLDRPRNETHRPAGARARNRVSQRRQGIGRQRTAAEGRVVEDVISQQPAVYRQGAQHEGVHGGPADGRWGCAFVQGAHAFAADGLDEAVPWAGELGGGGGLEADFDRVEWMPDGEFGDAAEYAGDEAIIG